MVGGTELGEIHVSITAEQDSLTRGLKQAEAATKRSAAQMAENLSRVGRSLAGAGQVLSLGLTAPAIAGFSQLAKASSDLTESLSRAKVTFGEHASAILAFSETQANALGVSREAALGYAGTFGQIFKSSGIGQKAAAELSQQLVTLAADMASFHNIGIEESLEKLRSGIVGEIEPLRVLGVLMSEAAVKSKAAELGLERVGGELSEGQKVAARYALIMAQTKDAQGDVARTASGLANQTKFLEAEFKNLSSELGKELVPLALDLIEVVRGAIKQFRGLDEETRANVVRASLFAAALGPVLIAIGGVAQGISALIALRGAVVGFWAAHTAGAAAAAAASNAAAAAAASAGAAAAGAGAAGAGAGAGAAAGGALALAAGAMGAVGGTAAGLSAILMPAAAGGPITGADGKVIATRDTPFGMRLSQMLRMPAEKLDSELSRLFRLLSYAGPVAPAARTDHDFARQLVRIKQFAEKYEQWKAGLTTQARQIDVASMVSGLRAAPGRPSGGPRPEGRPAAAEGSAEELTTDMIMRMANSVKSPGGKAAPACAYFASMVIAQFTKGVTDQGRKTEWSAGGLVERLKSMGAQVVSASEALPGALAFRPGSGPSGVHVGIATGDGRVVDMNGQRDGRRNTRGLQDASRWQGFLNIPERFMDSKFQSGVLNEDVVAALRAVEAQDARLADANYRIAEAIARMNDPRTELADFVGVSLREFKAFSPEEQARLKAGFEVLKSMRLEEERREQAAAEGAKAWEEFARSSEEANRSVGEAYRQVGEDEARRREDQRLYLAGIQRQIDLGDKAADSQQLLYDWEHKLGEAARLTKTEVEARVAALRGLEKHQASVADAALFESRLAEMRAAEEEDRREAWRRHAADQTRYQDVLRGLAERLEAAQGVGADAILRGKLLGQGLGDAQAGAVVEIDRTISKMEEQRRQIELIADAGANSFRVAFSSLFSGGGVGGFFSGLVSSFREALASMLAELLASQVRREIAGLFKISGPESLPSGLDSSLAGQAVSIATGMSAWASTIGARAAGGPVSGGMPYLVGERGPELFIPAVGGTVVSHERTAALGSPVVVNVAIQANDPGQFRSSLGQVQASIGMAVERAVRRNSGR